MLLQWLWGGSCFCGVGIGSTVSATKGDSGASGKRPAGMNHAGMNRADVAIVLVAAACLRKFTLASADCELVKILGNVG